MKTFKSTCSFACLCGWTAGRRMGEPPLGLHGASSGLGRDSNLYLHVDRAGLYRKHDD